MKLTHRISSFLLALVLLFGCVSTSVFATDSAVNEEEQANGTAHTHDYSDPTIDLDGDKLCDACVAEQLTTNKGGIIAPEDINNHITATTDRMFANVITATKPYGFGTISDNGNRHALVTEDDGNNYITVTGSKTDSNAVYFRTQTRYGSAQNIVQRFKERTNKSFVVSLDVKLDCELDNDVPLITVTTYMGNKGNETITEYSLEHKLFNLIKGAKDGSIQYRDGSSGTYGTYISCAETDLITTDFNNVSIHVRPEVGEYGVYDLYFNGKLVKSDIQFLTSSEDASITWTYEGTGTATNHMEKGYKVQGANDFIPSWIYFGIPEAGRKFASAEGDENAVIFSIDSAKAYFSEDYIECVHEFKNAGKHTHDVSANKIVETFVCHCGEVQEVKLPLDTVTAGICDTCGVNVKGNGIIAPEDINNHITATTDRMFANVITATKPYGFGTISDNGNRHALVTEDDGNNYITVTGSKTDSNAVYFRTQTRYGSAQNIVQRFKERTNKSFVVSLDVKLDCELDNDVPLITVTTYMGNKGNETITEYSLEHKLFNLIKGAKDGGIQYRDGSSGTYITCEGTNLITDNFNNVSIHVRPEDGEYGVYDLYFNGKLVKSDIQFLTSAEDASITWTYEGTGTATNHMEKGYKVQGANDFIPSWIYFGIPEAGRKFASAEGDENAVIFSIDSAKAYFSEDYIECASHQFETVKHEHDYKTGELVDTLKCHCGATEEMRLPFDRNGDDLCDECGETVIVIVARQVLLDELIGLKIYAYIGDEALENQNNKAIFTVADKTEEILFSEATVTDGLYEFEIKLTSIQMAEQVALSFEVDGAVITTYTTSIKDYAETLIEDENQTEKTRELAKALLNYGAAAQEYFVGRNGNPETLADYLANAGLSEADKTVKQYTADELVDYTFTATGETPKVRYNGASFIFSSKTYMKIYFTAPEEATVTVDGIAYAKVQSGNEYYVIVTVPSPAKASVGFNIVITDGNTEASSKIAVHTVAQAAITNSEIEVTLVKLINAYINYCDTAKKYEI